jgi:hypothetical protein
VRSYKASESGARDLIGTAWTVLGSDVEATATIVNALVDLLDDEDKKKELLAAWNGFKVERRQEFPDLVPTSVGSGFAGRWLVRRCKRAPRPRRVRPAAARAGIPRTRAGREPGRPRYAGYLANGVVCVWVGQCASASAGTRTCGRPAIGAWAGCGRHSCGWSEEGAAGA